MIYCSIVGCTNPPAHEIERLGNPVNSPSAKMKEFRCDPCLEQDKRMESYIRIIKTY